MVAVIAEDRDGDRGAMQGGVTEGVAADESHQESLLCRPAPCFSGTPLSPSRGNLRATRVPPDLPPQQDASFPTPGATHHAP